MKMPGLISAILLPAFLCAQKPTVKANPYAQTDARALQLPDSSSHEVSRIAAYMTSNFTTATEKTRAWLTQYLRKGRMGRKSMFFKTSVFGVPIN
jgi:hypothetical protein